MPHTLTDIDIAHIKEWKEDYDQAIKTAEQENYYRDLEQSELDAIEVLLRLHDTLTKA